MSYITGFDREQAVLFPESIGVPTKNGTIFLKPHF